MAQTKLPQLFEALRQMAEHLHSVADANEPTHNNALAEAFPHNVDMQNVDTHNMDTHSAEAAPSLMDELVATILSQNTSDINSSRAFQHLKMRYQRWHEVMNAPTAELADTIRAGGLADQKAARIQDILRRIAERSTDADGEPSLAFLHDESTPAALAYLCAFKGVGVKTAACVLMFGLGRELCAVDTHIHRILNRTGLVTTRSADETFDTLQAAFDEAVTTLGKAYPHGLARLLHVRLIRLGKAVCTARTAYCKQCPLAEECATARSKR
jgi:endonuclease-3